MRFDTRIFDHGQLMRDTERPGGALPRQRGREAKRRHEP
jgi:hypothetical protein